MQTNPTQTALIKAQRVLERVVNIRSFMGALSVYTQKDLIEAEALTTAALSVIVEGGAEGGFTFAPDTTPQAGQAMTPEQERRLVMQFMEAQTDALKAIAKAQQDMAKMIGSLKISDDGALAIHHTNNPNNQRS